jgi:hypothetical protein
VPLLKLVTLGASWAKGAGGRVSQSLSRAARELRAGNGKAAALHSFKHYKDALPYSESALLMRPPISDVVRALNVLRLFALWGGDLVNSNAGEDLGGILAELLRLAGTIGIYGDSGPISKLVAQVTGIMKPLCQEIGETDDKWIVPAMQAACGEFDASW